MSLVTTIGGVFSGIADVVKTPLAEWQRRKTIKTEADIEVAKIEAKAKVANANVKLEIAKNGQQITAGWDSKAQDAMKTSWKDEFLLVLLFLPVMGLFLPLSYRVNMRQESRRV